MILATTKVFHSRDDLPGKTNKPDSATATTLCLSRADIKQQFPVQTLHSQSIDFGLVLIPLRFLIFQFMNDSVYKP